MWMPFPIVESPKDSGHEYNLVARLRPGISRTQAEADLKDGLLQLKNTYPDLWDRNESVRALDFHDSLLAIFVPRSKFSWVRSPSCW